MKQLEDVGIAALRVEGNKNFGEAMAGKFRFGM